MTSRKRSTFRRRRSTATYIHHLEARGEAAALERELRIAAAARSIAARLGIRRGAA